MVDRQNKIYIAGHKGMVGSSLSKRLSKNNYIITASRGECDLTSQLEVKNFLNREKPDSIYICAARVGGIHANNTFPADFLW
jgi:GDP-L-fucose synthase